MKKIIAYALGFGLGCLVALLIAGCAPSTRFGAGTSPADEAVKVTKVTETVVRIEDSEYDVLCYFYADFDGGGALSCIPYPLP